MRDVGDHSCGWPWALLWLGSLLLIPSCQRESAHVVARVEGAAITRAEVEAGLARRARVAGARFDAEAARREVLEELIREQVLLARAKAAGYDRRPDLRRQFERLIVRQFAEDQRTNIPAPPAPTEADLERYYREHPEEFAVPEQVRVALIRLDGSTKATAEKQQELRARAESLRAEAQALPATEPTFGELARQHSDDLATRYTGGDCGWVARGPQSPDWPREVVEAMFALAHPGELSPVISAQGDCYLLKLIARKPAGVRPLEQVRERIAYHLSQQQREQAEREFHARQRAGLRIQVHEAALARVRAPSLPSPGSLAQQRPAPKLPAQ